MPMRPFWAIFVAGALAGASATVFLSGIPFSNRSADASPGSATAISAQKSDAAARSPEAGGLAVPSETVLRKLRHEIEALTKLRDELRKKTNDLSAELAATLESAPQCLQADLGDASGDFPSPAPHVVAEVAEAAVPVFKTGRLHAEHLDGVSMPAVQDAFEDANRELAMLESAAYQQGWGDDPSLHEQRLALRQSLQDYLGPDAFLAGLYATGMPNRLVVTKVAPGTDAASQGLRRGDVLLSVNGHRVFDKNDFGAITGSLVPGGPVQVEILRNGQSLRLLVENPGASLELYAQRVDPDNYYAAE
jgi:hypothetical protein